MSKEAVTFFSYKLVVAMVLAVAVSFATRSWTSPIDSTGMAIGLAIGVGTLERQWIQEKNFGRILMNVGVSTPIGWAAYRFVAAPLML